MRNRLPFTALALALATQWSSGALVAQAAPAPAPAPQALLWDAAIAGDTGAILRALATGAVIDSLDTRRSRNGRRALNWAALTDHPEVIRLLLARGAQLEALNLTGNTALHHAAEAGSLNAARALLIAGADLQAINADGNRPIDIARANQRLEVVTLLEKAERGERPAP